MALDVSIGNEVTLRAGSGVSLGEIDQYELVRELGGGGFGTVFLARDTVAGVDVAVKGLPPLVRNNKEELENIRRNFALVSRLHHPHIAAALVLHPVHHATYAERSVAEKLRVFDGDFLVVMEFAPGVTLSQWRKQFGGGKVPVEKSLEIVRQVADALDYAHAVKIIHRDIKPANVMIETREDGSLIARVLDFGLAAEVRSSMGRISQQVTDTSGTRPYMAPEQWLGKKQGAATDQYALAVLFYELVTGEVPFASVFETGDPVVMMNVVGRESPELSGDIPSSMRRTMLRSLAKTPDERFGSCGEFSTVLTGAKTSTRRMVGNGSRHRSRTWICLGACAAFAMLLAGGFWCWQSWQRRQAAESRAIAQRDAKRVADEKVRTAERKRLADEDRTRTETAAKEAVFSLAVSVENAKAAIDGETEDVKSFFSSEINEFDKTLRSGNLACTRSEYVAASNFFARADVMARSLKQSVGARKEYLAAADKAEKSKDAVDALEASVERGSRYEEAKRLCEEAKSDAAARCFAKAIEKVNSASRLFMESRQDVIKAEIACAQAHRESGKWTECLASAEKVLGWDPGQADACALRDEANRHLAPTLRMVAKIGEREVKATLKANGGQKCFPIDCPAATLVFGKNIPDAGCAVEYNEDGRYYVGRVPTCTVDWKGEQEIVISLKVAEYIEVRTGKELYKALRNCQRDAIIFLHRGEYSGSMSVYTSVSLVGESRASVKLSGSLEIYAPKDGGDIDCKIKSITVDAGVCCPVSALGHNDFIALEVDDCDFLSSGSCAFRTHRHVSRLMMSNCRLKASDRYSALSIGTPSEESMSVNCSDCEISNEGGPAVHCSEKSSSIWERCRFSAGSDATASFSNSHHNCSLFNSCQFNGGAKGIQYGTSKCYNCTFSGPMCDDDAFGHVTKSTHKLTEADFEFH